MKLYFALILAFVGILAYLDYQDTMVRKESSAMIEAERVQCEARGGALVWVVHKDTKDHQLLCVQYRLAPLTVATK